MNPASYINLLQGAAEIGAAQPHQGTWHPQALAGIAPSLNARSGSGQRIAVDTSGAGILISQAADFT